MENHLSYYPSSFKVLTAVTLVAHGLNLKPEAMLSLIGWLREQGSDVFLVRLSGHRNDESDIEKVTADLWQKEMGEGYQKAKWASVDASVPLFFLGYSLGGLLGQSMIAMTSEKIAFDRQVLIAPAIAIRPRSYLLKLFFPFGKQRKLPSYTPEGYKVNDSLPLLIYKILFREEKKLVESKMVHAAIPTLIIIDPKDELISFSRLKKRLKQFGLNNCQVIALNAAASERKTKYHHLIIDEETMGKSNWKRVTIEMTTFLFG